MQCPRCQEVITDPQARFCPLCGSGLPVAPPPEALPPPDTGEVAAHCAVHPERLAASTCYRCGSFACQACLHTEPDGRSLCDRCFVLVGAGTWQVPWEERERLGLLSAYWQTTQVSIADPALSVARLAPSEGSLWHPLSYALASVLVGSSGMLVVMALMAVGMAAVGSWVSKDNGAQIGFGIGMAVMLGTLGFLPFFALIKIFVFGGIEHLVLVASGPRLGFRQTVRAQCYSMGPWFLGVLPVCGMYVFPLWEMILRIFAMKSVHRISSGRAAAAVLVPTALWFGLGWAGSLASTLLGEFLKK